MSPHDAVLSVTTASPSELRSRAVTLLGDPGAQVPQLHVVADRLARIGTPFEFPPESIIACAECRNSGARTVNWKRST